MHAPLVHMMPLASVQLHAVSVEGLILLVFNVLVLVALGAIGFLLRRFVSQQDRREEKIDKKVDELDKRVWQSAVTMGEKYATRHEVMRLHGSLMQEVRGMREEITGKLEDLPCLKAACPGGAGGESNG